MKGTKVSNRSVLIQIAMDETEDEIVSIYRIKHKLKTKAEAIKQIIRGFKE